MYPDHEEHVLNITCISDTHGFDLDLPGGDVLVHAGDLTADGTAEQARESLRLLSEQARRYRACVLIAGNHDLVAERFPERWRDLLPGNVTYLRDRSFEFGGMTFWGTPWTARFGDWAFMESEDELDERFARIPTGVDVLVSHGPVRGLLDVAVHGEHVGSLALRTHLPRIAPRLLVHGHIHEAYGEARSGRTHIVNASICDHAYRPANAPIIVTLDPTPR